MGEGESATAEPCEHHWVSGKERGNVCSKCSRFYESVLEAALRDARAMLEKWRAESPRGPFLDSVDLEAKIARLTGERP